MIPEVQDGMTSSKEDEHDFPETVKQVLLTLTPKDRALFFSRAVEEQSYKELSEIYGKSEAVLRKRYERARKKLKASLINKEEL